MNSSQIAEQMSPPRSIPINLWIYRLPVAIVFTLSSKYEIRVSPYLYKVNVFIIDQQDKLFIADDLYVS